MDTLTWTTLDPRTWHARTPAGDYLIHRAGDGHACTLEAPDRVWRSLPDLEIAQEVAALADEVHDDDGRLTLYRVVTTTTGTRCGETFGAADDDAALRILRARRRAGNLPLTAFTLETERGRTVGSWYPAAGVPAPPGRA